MGDFTFKPAGVTIAAIVAGLAPAPAQAGQAVKTDPGAEIAAAAASFAPATPFGETPAPPRQGELFE